MHRRQELAEDDGVVVEEVIKVIGVFRGAEVPFVRDDAPWGHRESLCPLEAGEERELHGLALMRDKIAMIA